MRLPLERTVQNGLVSSIKYYSQRLREKTTKTPAWASQPLTLQLDTTNRKCSLQCRYCNPQSSFIGERGNLPLSTIDYVAGELNRLKIAVNYAYPFMNSDPLLEHRLPEITKLLKKRLKCPVLVSSNGVLYSRRRLLDDANLNDICFTISAGNSELYAKVHGKPLFNEAVKTVNWVNQHRRWNQRIWIRYILFKDNVDGLGEWQRKFSGFKQEIRPLHYGVDRTTSGELKDVVNPVIEKYHRRLINNFVQKEVPCNCFSDLAISFDGRLMQCCDLPYEYNWGHIEEIDLLETYRKRLDLGLNHKGCQGCNQKNPYWRELFEKYVW